MTVYRVTGLTAFLDNEPGEEFEADLDAELEERALERGSIEIVTGEKKAKEVSEDG